MVKKIWLAGVFMAATMTFGLSSATFAEEEKSPEALRQEQAAKSCLAVDGDVQQRIDSCTYLIDNSDQLILRDESRKPQYMAVFHYNRAANYLEIQSLNEALNDLNKAIEFDPNYSSAYFMRGDLHKKLGNAKQAKADFKMAAELEPDNDKYRKAAKG